MVWKQHPFYTDYLISDEGIIWSKLNSKPMAPALQKSGYFMTRLLNRQTAEFDSVYYHRCVYEAFHGAIPPGYDVHHINGNRADNRADNLSVLTHAAHRLLHAKLAKQEKYNE